MPRRGWGPIAIAILVAVAVVMSLARPSAADEGDPPLPSSYTVEVPLLDNFDRADAAAWAADMNNRNPLLSDTIRQQLALYPLSLETVNPQHPPVPGFTVWTDFDGTAAVTDTGVSITIQTNAALATSLSSWELALLAVGVAAFTYAFRFVCLALVLNPVGGIAAAAICTGFGAFLGAMIAGVIKLAADGQLRNGKEWGIVVAVAVALGLLGVGWEAWLSPFVKANGPAMVTRAGQITSQVFSKVGSWFPSLRSAGTAAGAAVEENADGITLGIIEGLEQAPPTAMNMRVLPLGDSITYGVGTPDNSSYRARLADLLDDDVDSLEFVGSQRTGALSDRDNEGHPGWSISQINQIASCTVRQYRPNIVTLHIGTNDMNRNISVSGAPNRLRELLRTIFDAAPETTVLLAKLIPSTNPTTMNRIQAYNEAIPGIAAEFRATGRIVQVVDMGAVTPGDMTDSLHPNANGYRKMADAFYKTISDVVKYDAFKVAKPGVPGACDGVPGIGTGGSTGSVNPSGSLGGAWDAVGVVASGAGPREEVRFADLNGDGRDDYLLVGAQGQVRAWFNAHGGSDGVSWQSMGEVAAGSAPREEVRFADINGDGRDDYLAVGAQGQVKAWLNVGSGNAVGWAAQGQIAAGSGPRESVRFADINGDGRDDYLVLDAQGVAQGWLNNRGPGGTSWDSAGVVAAGVGATRDEVRFTDLDGDSRDDYLVVSATGQVRAWLNTYSGSGPGWLVQGEIATSAGAARADVEFADLDGGGSSDYLVVNSTGQVTAWLDQVFGDNGRWDRQGVVATGVGATLPEVRFADLNGDGRDDYLVVNEQGAVRAWLNNRGGSPLWDYRGQVAAGSGPRESVRFADINGDGRDDYLVVGAQGQVNAWFNVGTGNNVAWQAKGQVAAGSGARDDIRFADINGDRRDDYLVIGAQGQVKAWLNTGNSTSVVWAAQGEIATGVGLPGSMVTFADIDGDLQDDYLAVSDSGRIWAWVNNRGSGGSWAPQGEIATGVGATRNQVNLADYNGDRRDDYLVVDNAGVVNAWTNNGQVRKD